MSKKFKKQKNIIVKEDKIMNNEEMTMTDETLVENQNAMEGQMSLDLDVPVVETPEEAIIPNEPETSPEVDDEELKGISTGKLIDCARLNVRLEPSKESEVVVVANDSDTFLINDEESTEEFYKVEVNGFTGFCMKKFIVKE